MQLILLDSICANLNLWFVVDEAVEVVVVLDFVEMEFCSLVKSVMSYEHHGVYLAKLI